jgi:hypothetical protein
MKNIIILTGLIFILSACNKNKIDPDFGKPFEVNLLFPTENSLCNVGTDSTDTESNVKFEWNASENTDEYELNLKNLITGDSISKITADLKMSLRILRATPYAWYIVSKSKTHEKTTKSVVWKFYNAGVAISNYAPFPAEITSPKMAETLMLTTGVITLSWTGSDIDKDITGYDVYFGTTNPPVIIKSNQTEHFLNNVPISTNTVYYWKIITKDTRGNSSDSGVYQFKVK